MLHGCLFTHCFGGSSIIANVIIIIIIIIIVVIVIVVIVIVIVIWPEVYYSPDESLIRLLASLRWRQFLL